jgi:hypothetical protein
MKYLICSTALFLAATNAFAAESWWPQFRGPNCSGVSETARPPAEFGPGTNQLWKVAVPGGLSSPVVWGDRIFLTAFDAGKLEVHCYARRDGKQLGSELCQRRDLKNSIPRKAAPRHPVASRTVGAS